MQAGNRDPSISGGGRGDMQAEDARRGDGFGLFDLLHNNWHWALILYSLQSIARKAPSKGVAIQQAAAIVVLVLASVKLERVLSKHVLGPLFNSIFGSNEELRARLDEQEREMKELLAKAKEESARRSAQVVSGSFK